MKGVLEKAAEYLPAILLLIALLVASLWLYQWITKEDIEQVLDISLDENGGFIDHSKQEPFTLEYVRDLIDQYDPGEFCGDSSTRPCQPSDVACEIATTIFNDYAKNANGGPRLIEGGKNCENNQCIIGAKKFELEVGDSFVAMWEASLDNYQCHFCYDQPSSTRIRVFDEVCVNYNLKDKEIDPFSIKICSQTFGNPVGGGSIEFGNNDCGETARNGAVWQSHCDGENNDADDFCDGAIDGEDKIIWIGDNVARANIICACGTNDWQIADGFLDRGNSLELDTTHQYVYGIIWDSVDEQYDLVFVRIPKERTLDETTSPTADNIIENIDEDLLNLIRHNRIGNWYKEAREVEYVTVTPSTGYSKSIGGLTQDIADRLFGWISDSNERLKYVLGTLCYSEDDCRYTEPKDGDYTDDRDEFRNYEKVTIKVDGRIGLNGQIEGDKTYKISVKNWFYENFNKVDRTVTIWCDAGC